MRVRLKWLTADQRTSLRQTQSSELKLAPSLTIKLAPSLRASKYRQRAKDSRAERIKALRASGHWAAVGERAKKMTIAYHFVNTFDAPDESEWASERGCDGSGNNGWLKGTIALIAEKMEFKDRNHFDRAIRPVLERVNECAMEGEEYDGGRVGDKVQRKGGWMIPEGSVTEQLIANLHEQGMGVSRITRQVNFHLREEGKIHVGRSCVYQVTCRLKPVKTIIQPRKQVGGPEWEKAGWHWAAQRAVRLGLEIPAGSEPWDTSEPLPPEFDIEKLGRVSPHQVVSYDECHKKQVFDGLRKHTSHAATQVRYRRDPITGKLDPNGKLAEERTELHVKYEDESRYCLGGAAVQIRQGSELIVQGRRAEPFVYTGCWVHTINSYEQLGKAEINRVRNLPGKCLPWVVNKRPAGVLHETELLNKMKNVGDVATGLFLALSPPVQFIGDLKALSVERRAELKAGAGTTTTMKGFSKQGLGAPFFAADNALPGEPDYIVDYRKFENPYLEWFGEQRWEMELARRCEGGGQLAN